MPFAICPHLPRCSTLAFYTLPIGHTPSEHLPRARYHPFFILNPTALSGGYSHSKFTDEKLNANQLSGTAKTTHLVSGVSGFKIWSLLHNKLEIYFPHLPSLKAGECWAVRMLHDAARVSESSAEDWLSPSSLLFQGLTMPAQLDITFRFKSGRKGQATPA